MVEAFQALCTQDPIFNDSVRSTTKTVGATGYRLSAWGAALAATLQTHVRIPALSSDRKSISFG
ncbi:hypothetical protein GCM10025868_26790 [Angustibacter aerolatus]|uniref:Uncharacterized protein n=1 Tax=Angustibacter aerolatus TaxID=1162965 RepID=A0ABQ6JJ84_9ACTN|nr:hypothetical protein GCM10025868_26790 [Angustibacter aerolatus]